MMASPPGELAHPARSASEGATESWRWRASATGPGAAAPGVAAHAAAGRADAGPAAAGPRATGASASRISPLRSATRPPDDPDGERLLVIDPAAASIADQRITDLPEKLAPGDVLVVNDAATLPASLRVDAELELRLASELGDGSWLAVALGPLDHRTPTERRPPPRRLLPGERLQAGTLTARILGAHPLSPRLLRLRFLAQGAALWRGLYAHGRPIQYAHVPEPLALWDVQTHYAARPWALEMPSAGRPLSFRQLGRLKRRGVRVVPLTHAAGISATGVDELDATLPWPERYELPAATVDAIEATRRAGGRVVAVGTSVVRALEDSAARHGRLRPGEAVAELVLDQRAPLRVADGLLTGMHPPGTSHFSLMTAFAPPALLERALDHAARAGYLEHEFGDSALILDGRPSA